MAGKLNANIDGLSGQAWETSQLNNAFCVGENRQIIASSLVK